jgi:3-deoxy-7-phosphoheptulonate synthase
LNNKSTHDIRILAEVPLVSPQDLARRIPLTDKAVQTVLQGRAEAQEIISGKSKRMLAIVGPCSIHNVEQAIEYAQRLAKLREQVKDQMAIIMRVYFEKPRTTLGWRGLLVDPMMDGSYDIALGLSVGRKLLIAINEAGVPAGAEILDPITPQYIAELISWASIGARTTESQIHRELASGMSMPVGFKNATDGDVQIAVNAIASARAPHSFVGIDHTGNTSVLRTAGNTDSHLILRGGKNGPNYMPNDITLANELLIKAGLAPSIIVDCSHGNSNKKPEKQAQVLTSLIDYRSAHTPGTESIIGFMIESNLEHGSQTIPADKAQLKHGVSITDACIGWDETSALLLEAADRLRAISAR